MTDISATNPRIGIFGGTFNPIHQCHIRVAAHCRDWLGLDRVRFIPAGTPPLKQADLAPAADRLAMVRIATAEQAGFEVDPIEVERPERSFTLNTLTALQTNHPDTRWTLILGLDTLLGIGDWHRPDQVLRQVPIAVPFRPGAHFGDLEKMPLLSGIDFAPLHHTATGTGRPITVQGDGIHLTLLPIPPCPVSATAIRAAVRSGKTPVPGLSPMVASYIIEHHLYE